MTKNLISPFHLQSVTLSVGKQSPSKFDYQYAMSPEVKYNLPPVSSRNQQDLFMKPSVRFRNYSLISNILGQQESLDLDKKHKFQAMNEVANNQKVEDQKYRAKKNQQYISQSVKVNNNIANFKRRLKEKSLEGLINNENYFEYPSKEISTPYNYLGIIKSRFTQESELSEKDEKKKETNKLSEDIKKIKKYTTITDLLSMKYVSPFKRLKNVSLFVRAAMRFSQKYRKTQKKQQKEYNNLLLQKKIHQTQIDKFDQEQIQKQHQKFVNTVTLKMSAHLQQKQYISECEIIWQKLGDLEKDMRRTRFCVLSFIFLQNLEFLTRKDNMPSLIQHQLNISLFSQKGNQISQFVANRCLLFSETLTKISPEFKLLIASEYFFFEVLCPNLINLFNNVKPASAFHKNQTLYYGAYLFDLLQILFTKFFKRLNPLEKDKVCIIPIQRKFKIQTDSKTKMMQLSLVTVSKLEGDELQIISGEFQANQTQVILKERKKWGQKVYKLFCQVLLNLQQQLII